MINKGDVIMNMIFERKLAIPQEVKQMYPASAEIQSAVKERTDELKDIFAGKNDKFILIIGPDMFKGIVAIRELHMKAIQETGFACADEMLYPENSRYLDDLLGYNAVGARSVENQQHRLTASGLDVPVGMKNPTSGDISVMMNSITAAQHKHTFIFRGWEVHSEGNEYAHAILRGYVNKHGQSMPNYHYEDLVHLNDAYQKSGLFNPSVIIDTNHSNSGKDPIQQIRIAKEIINSMHYNPEIKSLVKGLMIESYIEDGNQPIGCGIYGKSITDACLGWKKSEKLVLDIADKL